MAAFEYLALDDRGREKKGVLEADTARLARQLLRQQSLTPLEVREASGRSNSQTSGSASKSGTSQSFRGGIKTNDLALLTRQIATLSAAGTPLEESLSAVSRQSEKPRIKSLLLSVRAKVLEGHTFASALSDFPKVFPEIYQATVSAGEQSGHLDAVLERLADYTEERQAANATIKKALIYPSVLVVASILIVGFLLAYVVPQVVQVFEGMDQELPALTQGMLAASAFVREWGLLILIVAVVATLAFKRAMQGEAFKTKVHSFLLKLPLFRRLIRGFNTAQFARTLSILALIASGESSGQLDSMLEKAAAHQERELNSLMAIFLGLFEPVVILIMGGVVLTIVLGILLPIFEMNQLVN